MWFNDIYCRYAASFTEDHVVGLLIDQVSGQLSIITNGTNKGLGLFSSIGLI